MFAPPFHIVIPARYAAQRLPGKPLRDVAGRPLVARVLDVARAAEAQDVVVAADDERIVRAVEAEGGRALMTSPTHACGTDRIAEVADALAWPDDAIVVNLQGDEPLLPPVLLGALARALAAHPRAGIATMATPIHTPADLYAPHIVKVVLDDAGLALYFSRAPIPWVRDAFTAERPPASLPESIPFLRHLGLYAYRAGTLRRLAMSAQSPIERAESLEQLRALSLGIPIHVTVVPEAPPHGVDTEADLERVRAELRS
jgi:3-deoxy-manno-octulosonate cytidylyltransferase (CMP-KDO synthetase)